MGEWITDRKPKKKDAYKESVWLCRESGYVDDVRYGSVILGEPWMPISKPEPYVKPKRFVVKRMMDIYSDIESCGYCVYNNIGGVFAKYIPTREAAERIAAIYEEVMP